MRSNVFRLFYRVIVGLAACWLLYQGSSGLINVIELLTTGRYYMPLGLFALGAFGLFGHMMIGLGVLSDIFQSGQRIKKVIIWSAVGLMLVQVLYGVYSFYDVMLRFKDNAYLGNLIMFIPTTAVEFIFYCSMAIMCLLLIGALKPKGFTISLVVLGLMINMLYRLYITRISGVSTVLVIASVGLSYLVILGYVAIFKRIQPEKDVIKRSSNVNEGEQNL